MDDATKQEILDMINKAAASGRFMIVVFRIEPSGIEQQRITRKFPTGDLLDAAAMLTMDMFAEKKAIEGSLTPPFEPLSVADLKPKLAVMTEEGEAPATDESEGCGDPVDEVLLKGAEQAEPGNNTQ